MADQTHCIEHLAPRVTPRALVVPRAGAVLAGFDAPERTAEMRKLDHEGLA